MKSAVHVVVCVSVRSSKSTLVSVASYEYEASCGAVGVWRGVLRGAFGHKGGGHVRQLPVEARRRSLNPADMPCTSATLQNIFGYAFNFNLQ